MKHPTPFNIKCPDNWLQTHEYLSVLSQSITDAYEQNATAEDATLQAMGEALWAALSLGDTLDQAKRAVGQAVLSIVIESRNAAVLNLPWETLYHPQWGFLGRNLSFALSRHNPSVSTQLPAIVAEPLKVLLFTALPDNLTEHERLDVEAEQATIQQAIMAYERSGEIQLIMPEDGCLATLQQALQDFQPQVVYFSGHGNFQHDPIKRQAYGSVWLEDAHGNGVTVTESEFAACFQNTQVQLLVLSACLSAKQHPHYPANGLSNALSRAGIPHVMGMRESVMDAAATTFAEHLLQALAKRQAVDIALQHARAAIKQLCEPKIYHELPDPQRAALAAGQWCLPQLLSHDPQRGLVDWRFTPVPTQPTVWQQQLGEISLPERFIGRRRELRQWQNRLRSPHLHSLLITGAGGMGKTALAGKLALALEQDGYKIFTLHAANLNWKMWRFQLLKSLSMERKKDFYSTKSKLETELEQNEYLFKLLLAQHNGKLVLFFDNLESVQDSQAPHALTDNTLQDWLTAAQHATRHGLKLLVTSRWRLPNWADANHYPLGKPVFGDYVALVRVHQLPLTGERLVRAYQTLGGNARALTYVAAAANGMNLEEEQNFSLALAQAESAAQIDMAIAKVVEQRSSTERDLLHCLLAYQTAVPLDGITAVWDMPQPAAVPDLLQRLLAVSLVEQYHNPHTDQTTYQLAALVRSWLLNNGAPAPTPSRLQAAAEFLHWQLENRIDTTWEHRLATHAALQAAALTETAQRLVLDWIVTPLNLAGMYHTLLNDWLLPIANADDSSIKGAVLNQVGTQYYALGQYDPALDYLKQSLAIQQEIGGEQGEGATLNNIGYIHKARGDYNTALDYYQQSLAIQQKIGDKQGEGSTLNNIGHIHHVRGDYDTALDYYQQSLTIEQQIGDKQGEDITLSNIAGIHYACGNYDTALDYYQQSLAIRQQIGDKSGEGATLNNIGEIYSACGDYDTALDYLQQSLTIRQHIGDKQGESTTLNNISQIHHARGDYDTALDYLKQSLAIFQHIGDKQGESATLNNIGQIHQARGDYNTALDYLQQSLTIQQEIGNKHGEGAALNNIGEVYRARSDYDTAIQHLQQSIAIQQHIGDKHGEGVTLNNIGLIHHARGDDNTALNVLQQSLTIRQHISDKKGEGATLNNIGEIYRARGDYDTALDYLQQSLAIRQEIGDMAGLCTTLFNMGHIHMRNEEVAEAVQAWVIVYDIAKQINLAQTLQALESLAGQIGLDGGLQGWEGLAQQIGENE